VCVCLWTLDGAGGVCRPPHGISCYPDYSHPPRRGWGVVRPPCATSRHQYAPPSSRAHPGLARSQGAEKAVGWRSPAVGTHLEPTPTPREGPRIPAPPTAPSCCARNGAAPRASREDRSAYSCSGGEVAKLDARCRRCRYPTPHAHHCNYCDHCNYRAAHRHHLHQYYHRYC
jgi:hypothetical protein